MLWMEMLRRDPKDPYAWAMVRRDLGGRPFFDLQPLRDIARDDAPLVIVQKSAQVGLTELMVSKALWAADTAVGGRGNVLYAMPTQNQMDDFAQSRFDPAIQNSAYLRSRLQPEPPNRKRADSRRLKRVGPGYIYLRGADSRRQMASIDADLVLLDEFDQMADGIQALAEKRLASSRQGQLFIASTPRLPEAGINALYLHSDQRRYHLTCTSCGLEQPLTWEENVDFKRAVIVCRDCRAEIDTSRPGRWIPQAPGNVIHGYHLNRLYSPWVNLHQMIEASEASGLHGIREFNNSDLGEVFAEPGGGLSIDDLDRCRGDYTAGDYIGEACVMGVDIGRVLHVVIRECPQPRRTPSPTYRMHQPIPQRYIDADTREPPPGIAQSYGLRPPPPADEAPGSELGRLVFAAEVPTFEDLDGLMKRYNVRHCVVDSQPEMHKASEFAKQHRGQVSLARYGREQPGTETQRYPDVTIIAANRTEVIDEMVARFRQGNATLPADARELGGKVKQGLGEYHREMLAMTRVTEPDSRDNWVAHWVNGRRDDHYAHAEVYVLLAAQQARASGFSIVD